MPDFYDPLNPNPQKLRQAHVTAYGYGIDNAYGKGKHLKKDGGADIAHTSDQLRPKVNGNPQTHLGFGSYEDPSSAAVHPNSGIPWDSKIYVPDRGWFIVEDHLPQGTDNKPVPLNKIDMWTGKSTDPQRTALDRGYVDVTIYPPKYNIPPSERHSPGAKWVRHYSQMMDKSSNTPTFTPAVRLDRVEPLPP